MEEPPPFPGDITTEEVARARRPARSRWCARSTAATATRPPTTRSPAPRPSCCDLVKQQRVHGIIGIGGGTATLVATSIMKQLPFGMPKLMASPMAAHPAYIDKYVGTQRHHHAPHGAGHRQDEPAAEGADHQRGGRHLRHGGDDPGHRHPLRQALRRDLVVRLRRDGGAGRHRHAGGRRLHRRSSAMPRARATGRWRR